MATLNPLEQKARSSFIKGFVVALLIGMVTTSIAGYLLFDAKSKESERINKQKKVIVLKADVKSGDQVTAGMFDTITSEGNVTPEGAVSTFDQLVKFFGSKEGEIDQEKTTLVAKTDMKKNTIVTTNMVALSTENTTSDLRKEQYNMIVLPIDLVTSETIDVRLRLPSGQDYIVLAKKRVTIPTIDSVPLTGTIQLSVTEDEILTMNAAIVDAYKIPGCKLYAIKYAEPGLQDKAVATYIPAADTLRLIVDDPNIVEQAKNGLVNFYNANNEKYRTGVASALSLVEGEEQQSSVESGTSSEVSAQKSDREKYLQTVQ